MQISNLPASNSFSSTDVLPIEINGVTYKVTGATLAAALQTLGNYLTPDNVANNLTTTAAGSVLDARQGKALNDKINATQSDIAIIIEGNQTTHTGGVAVGEYVIVRNSTISGITDGLYKATQAIPANTAIDSTYLAAVDGGGLNELNSKITNYYKYVDSENIYYNTLTWVTRGGWKYAEIPFQTVFGRTDIIDVVNVYWSTTFAIPVIEGQSLLLMMLSNDSVNGSCKVRGFYKG